MKIILRIVGILLALMGAVWFLQGINVLPGSMMTGQIQWAIYGALAILVGIGLFVFANRRRARPPEGWTMSTTSKACIPNINTRERRKRLAASVIQFAISLAVLAALIAIGADRWWRLVLLPMFWGAAAGFFQWRDKT